VSFISISIDILVYTGIYILRNLPLCTRYLKQRRLIEDLRSCNRANPRVHKKTAKDESTLTADLNNVCEAVNCFEKASTSIEVKAGHHRTIPLSLCNICVNKFVGDD
jgi:hypothetical protein